MDPDTIYKRLSNSLGLYFVGNAGLLLRYRLKCVICKKDSECENVSTFKNIDKACSKKMVLVSVIN